MHASDKCSNFKENGPTISNRVISANLSNTSLKQVSDFLLQIELKLNNLTGRMDQWKNALDNIDTRFNNIEKHLNIISPVISIPIASILPVNIEAPKRPIVSIPKPIIAVTLQRSTRSVTS